MRFMVIVKATKAIEDGSIPPDEMLRSMQEMGKFNETLVQAGVMLAGEGLQPSKEGARIRFDSGRTTVIDGPFTETKELIAGFWIVQGKSKEEVIERFAHAPFEGGQEIEIRRIAEAEDFEDSAPEVARELRKGASK